MVNIQRIYDKPQLFQILTVHDGHGVVVDVLARLDEHDGEDDDDSHGDVGAVDEVRVQWQPTTAQKDFLIRLIYLIGGP